MRKIGGITLAAVLLFAAQSQTFADTESQPVVQILPNAQLTPDTCNGTMPALTSESYGDFAQSRQSTIRARYPRIALALGGGGCKGIAHIGVLRAFERNNIPINCIVGTSMGATIGALYCAGVPLNEIEHAFIQNKIQKTLTPHLVSSTIANGARIMMGRSHGGIMSGRKLQSFMAQRVPANFTDLRIPFIAVTSDLADGQVHMIRSGNLPQAVTASNALPGLIRPIRIDGGWHLDGGVESNVPADCARTLGCDLVIAVNVDTPIGKTENMDYKHLHHVINRVTDMVLNSQDPHQFQHADLVLWPDTHNTPIMTFDTDEVRNAVRAGEEAANRAMPWLKNKIGNGEQTAELGSLQ